MIIADRSIIVSFRNCHKKIISSSWFLAKRITLILAIIPFILLYLISVSIFSTWWIISLILNTINKWNIIKQWIKDKIIGRCKSLLNLYKANLKDKTACGVIKYYLVKLRPLASKICKIVLEISKDYLDFIKRKYSKFPIRISSVWFIVMLTYLYTMKLFAMNSLLGIDKGFFTLDAIELKLWDGFFTLLGLMGTLRVFYILLVLIYVVIITTSPFYLFEAFQKAKIEQLGKTIFHKILIKFTPWFVVFYIAIMVLLTIILMFLRVSENISIGINEQYLKNTPFCEVYYHEESAPNQLSIIDNHSVPYKLILKESEIFYFKPNESTALWHEFTKKERIDIESLCAHRNEPDDEKNNK